MPWPLMMALPAPPTPQVSSSCTLTTGQIFFFLQEDFRDCWTGSDGPPLASWPHSGPPLASWPPTDVSDPEQFFMGMPYEGCSTGL